MFNNIGSKIKTVAQVVTWIGVIASVIGGMIMMVSLESPIGLLIMIGGPLLSWVSSLTLYGFGQLIENTDILVGKRRESNTHENIANVFEKTEDSNNSTNLYTRVGTCELCDKKDVEVINCKIVDSMGTRYRNICADCMLEHKATLTGK